MQVISGIPVFGAPLENAVRQMENVAVTAERTALMADHHLGYSMPIGGVAAYRNAVSPSGVGYDIACGNKAVRLDIESSYVRDNISSIMDTIAARISFGIGRVNEERVEHPLFDDDPAWDIPAIADLKDLAYRQLGTVGGGNHYVDIFVDETDAVWIGVHFGSRGFGHKMATHFLKAGGAKNGIDAPPLVLSLDSDLGQQYVMAMQLAGRYAYAGRDHVCSEVAEIIGGEIVEEVHNHHNFAWEEEHFGEMYWVIRKGATPAFTGQLGFVGSSMGEESVILKGVDSDASRTALYSTVHGAGRVMSRREATGRSRWKPKKDKSGKVSVDMMREWVEGADVELRGGDVDESPHCYKRLSTVLEAHTETIEVVHRLKPIGVAMAPPHTLDPYKD